MFCCYSCNSIDLCACFVTTTTGAHCTVTRSFTYFQLKRFEYLIICISPLIANSIKLQFSRCCSPVHYIYVWWKSQSLFEIPVKLCFFTFRQQVVCFFKSQSLKLNIELCRISIVLFNLIVRKNEFAKKMWFIHGRQRYLPEERFGFYVHYCL